MSKIKNLSPDECSVEEQAPEAQESSQERSEENKPSDPHMPEGYEIRERGVYAVRGNGDD